MQYMENQWFRNPTVSPQEICQYRRLGRTNNDVEGYHRRLNIRIENTHPPLYQLLEVIWRESQLVDVTAKIVSSANVRTERKRKTLENQRRLEDLWAEYEAGALSIEEFLEQGSNYAPFS